MNTCLVYFVLTYVQKIDEERRSRGQFRLLDRFSCNINFELPMTITQKNRQIFYFTMIFSWNICLEI